MNSEQLRTWQDEALDTVFRAMAQSETLCGRLIFKGGRILHQRLLGMARQSYDIDAAMTAAFVGEFPTRVEQQREIQRELVIALTRYLRGLDPVRLQLVEVKVELQPRDTHPLGWNAFKVRIRMVDLALARGASPPTLILDLSAPEHLGARATAGLDIAGYPVVAYTLERIAGEKLRAFLSTLPAYCAKTNKPHDVVRAKDLYDVARIAQAHPFTDVIFWDAVAVEFQLACASRYVDCVGIESFAEQLQVTRAVYEVDPTIPKDISFEAAWLALGEIVARFEATGVVPCSYPLEDGPPLP